MEFLRCLPSVFVIGNEYEILVTAKENGLFSVTVDGKVFYEENAGLYICTVVLPGSWRGCYVVCRCFICLVDLEIPPRG